MNWYGMLIFVAARTSQTKMAKIKELREKNAEELKKILAEKRDKVRALRFEIATKQVKNNQDIKKDKKDIARILTLLKAETK